LPRIIPVKVLRVTHERAETTFSLYEPDGIGRNALREVVENIGR